LYWTVDYEDIAQRSFLALSGKKELTKSPSVDFGETDQRLLSSISPIREAYSPDTG
jgi:hypothetical protein